MLTRNLRNDQWTKILEFLDEHPGVYVGEEAECRPFIDSVLWHPEGSRRTGAPWRDLPEGYGNWNSIYKRFTRWGGAQGAPRHLG